VRSGRHAAGALDAAVLRLKRAGRDAASAVGMGRFGVGLSRPPRDAARGGSQGVRRGA